MKENEQSFDLVIKGKIWPEKTTIFSEELKIFKDINSQLLKKFKIVEKTKTIKIKVPNHMFLDCKNGRITHIGFNKCNLSTFPLSICKLKSLESIFLKDDKLTKIPDTVGHLFLLKELRLGGNYLTELPKSLGNLKSLTCLGLGNNKFTTFPEWIVKSTSLEILGFENNLLTTLPGATRSCAIECRT